MTVPVPTNAARDDYLADPEFPHLSAAIRHIEQLEARAVAAEQRVNALADALRQIADGSWHIPGPGHHTTASFARAALDRQEQPLNNDAQQRRLRDAARELAVAYGLSDEEGMRRVVAALNAVRDADCAALDRHTQELA